MVDVNPQVFYDGAKTLTDLGTDIDAATTKLINALNDTGSMSGSSDAAKQWATSYDTRAADTIDNSRKLAQTLQYFASLVSLAGYNHALANYNANTNPNKGAGPTKPASVPPPIELCWIGAPAAGGPGKGLLCKISQVMDQIHVHIPDGDTDKLSKAAQAWRDFSGTAAISQAGSRIGDVGKNLAEIDSPEMHDLQDQLTKLNRSGQNIPKSANQLATACDNLKRPIDEVRKTIKNAFLELEKSITLYLAIDILATFVTAGAAVVLTVATAAKFAKDIDACAATVNEAVTVSKIEDIAVAAAKEERILADASKELDDVANLEAKTIEEETSGTGSGTQLTSDQLAGKQAADDVRARLAANGETISKGRNVAVARGTIDGEEISLDAVSGTKTPSGTVQMPESPTLNPISVDGSVERPTDSEFKILDQLAQKLNPDSKGVINLYTEREPCPACDNVIKQFQDKFPGVKVNVTNG